MSNSWLGKETRYRMHLERGSRRSKADFRATFSRRLFGAGVNMYSILKTAEHQHKRGDFPGAEKTLLNLLDKDPSFIEAERLLMRTYGGMGKIEEARAVFDRAERRGVKILYLDMMEIYGKNRKPEAAREIFDMSVKAGSAIMANYQLMADIYIKLGMPSEAGRILETSILTLDFSGTIRLAEALRKGSRKEEALDLIDSLLEGRNEDYLDENYVQARVVRAFCLFSLRRENDARREFASLNSNVPRSSVHFPRILCGYIFSGAFRDSEREEFRALLLFYLSEGNGNSNIRRDMILALETIGNHCGGMVQQVSRGSRNQ